MLRKTSNDFSLENSGQNSGVMASAIHGNVDNSTHNTFITPEKRRILPSLISKTIEKLAELSLIPEDELDKLYKINKEDLTSYNIPKKISHNHVIKYKGILEEYSQYSSICDEAFNIIDNNYFGCKTRILRSIKLLYDGEKGRLLLQHKDSDKEEIEIIRENADNIIDNIRLELKRKILQDEVVNIIEEDLEVGLIRVLCYSFVECKILEKPEA